MKFMMKCDWKRYTSSLCLIWSVFVKSVFTESTFTCSDCPSHVDKPTFLSPPVSKTFWSGDILIRPMVNSMPMIRLAHLAAASTHDSYEYEIMMTSYCEFFSLIKYWQIALKTINLPKSPGHTVYCKYNTPHTVEFVYCWLSADYLWGTH